MKSFITCIFFIAFFTHLNAQKSQNSQLSGTMSGRVIDADSKAPLEYATITILKSGSTKAVSGGVTNIKGLFKIDEIPLGTYTVTIDFIGYTINRIDSIALNDTKSNVSFGDVLLTRKSQTLQNVTVTSSKAIIENKIDKMVYNVDKDVTSQGGVATDVLKKVPQISVDVDGNVELQGSTSVRFLINGKPSSIFGSSIADALQSIPSSQIQSIEVITSPGAKYDAQGTGGIINIILKKSTIRGINGNISLSPGTRLENGSFNINYRHNNFGMNAYFSGNGQLKATTLNELNRISTDNIHNTKTSLLQNGTSTFVRNGFQTGMGFDWGITKKDNLSGNLGYHHFNNNDIGFNNIETIINDFSGNTFSDTSAIRNFQNNANAHSIDWSLNYKKSFKKENQELDISYNASNGKNNSFYSQSQYYPLSPFPFAGSNSNNPGISNEAEFTIDYTQPLSEKFIIETGVKNVKDKIYSAADVYTYNSLAKNYFLNSSQSNFLNYIRNVYAYYLSASFSLFHFLDVKTGGRYEYTTSNADYSTSHNVNIPSYNIFAPSFVISHSFPNNQSLKISYTYRIERPDYRDLNPFINFSDPHNISMGNPLLRPEIGHNYEIGYNKSFEKGGNINASLFYRKNTDDIKSYTTYFPTYKVGDSLFTDVSVTTRQNINADERMGVNLSGSIPVTTKFNLRPNFFLFEQRIIDNLNGGNITSAYGYRMNINASYLFNKDLTAEFFGNFRSKETNVQGSQTSFVSYNLALRKQLLNKKLSIGFSATNPFSRYVNQGRETFGSNFQQSSVRRIPYRSFGLSVMYKFGKLEFKKAKEEDPTNQNAPF